MTAPGALCNGVEHPWTLPLLPADADRPRIRKGMRPGERVHAIRGGRTSGKSTRAARRDIRGALCGVKG